MSRVLALIATIPSRRNSCERLLRELTKQTRQPDGVILRMDGYGATPAPVSPFPIICAERTHQASGPGPRWLLAWEYWRELRRHLGAEEPIIANLDDDVFTLKAPDLIKELVSGVEECGAAAAFGRTPDGKRAPPGKFSRGHLIYGGGCGLSTRAGHLEGLRELAEQIRAACGFDPLGICGDDDALVSAHLDSKGIKIRHAPTGVINCAAGTQGDSQTKQRLARREKLDEQKLAIAKHTGWRWPAAASSANSDGLRRQVGQ